MRFIAALMVALFVGCVAAPPEPIVMVERADTHAITRDAARTFFDMNAWIRPREQLALIDFLADVPSVTHPKVVHGKEYPGPIGEVWGWKGTHNTNGYGIGDWVLNAAQRYDNEAAFLWLRAHCMRNIYNYWMYFVVKGRGPNEATGYEYVDAIPGFVHDASTASGIPATELVVKHNGKYLVPLVYKWDGSSYGRHHTYDFLAHALLESRVGFTDAEHERIASMLEHYARQHVNASTLPVVTQRHEWAHYYVRTYVAIYRTFKVLYRDSALAGDVHAITRWELAQNCLRLAEGIVWYGFHPRGPGRPTAVQGRGGDWFWAWDQRAPDQPGWHQLNAIATSQPWYVGLRASAWFYLWTEPDCAQHIRDLIAWVIVEEARWCTRDWRTLPPATIDVHGTTTHNGWIQGGFLPGNNTQRWVFDDTQLLTASAWSALPEGAHYHPLTCIKHRESDDGYFARWWPNVATGKTRWHYPKIRWPNDPWPDAFGPRLDINGGSSWAGMPDVLFLAGLLTGNEEWTLTGIWLCHDYLAFSTTNHSGNTLSRAKADAVMRWYGFNKTRAFYWVACACGEVLRKMVLDGNYWANF